MKGAGFDPAFIPGLTASAVSSDEREDAKPQDAEPEDAKAEEPEASEASGESSKHEGKKPSGKKPSGKKADVGLVKNDRSPAMFPILHPYGHVVLQAQRADVHTVIVNGRVVK